MIDTLVYVILSSLCFCDTSVREVNQLFSTKTGLSEDFYIYLVF